MNGPSQLHFNFIPVGHETEKDLFILLHLAQASIMAAFHGRAMNNRRKLVIALGAGAIAVGNPLGSFAQQPAARLRRIGFLGPTSAAAYAKEVEGLRTGLRELGHEEGKNLLIEFRWAEANYAQLPALAAELAGLKVELIVSGTTPVSRALQKATTTIPIVIANVGDPVGSGLVKSLARPGGNITGLSNLVAEMNNKRLELLLGILPKLSRVAYLFNPANSQSVIGFKDVQAIGLTRGVTVIPAEAQTPQEIDNAFSAARRQNAGALMVALDGFLQQQKKQIVELTAKYRLPSMTTDPAYAEAGCLISYGTNLTEHFREAAAYVDKILKGAKPADLPIGQPTKFELIINRKTAKALGITIPQSLLISADKIIE
jgi:putative ABC transport system substrate-binding protein